MRNSTSKIKPFIIASALFIAAHVSADEWLSISGQPAQVNDIIEVPLKVVHPTQPSLGYDRIYYKLGRYSHDRRKVFDEYCEKNGARGIKTFSAASDLHDPKSFSCLDQFGIDRASMKTAVIGADNKLYLTDGHHTFAAFWATPAGGPELHVYLRLTRDYRDFSSMEDFWEQMKVDNNTWLLDPNDKPIAPTDLPKDLSLSNFRNDQYRALMYFTRRIAWNTPSLMSLPDAQFLGDDYPDVPFLEFFWAREVRKTVDLSKFDLMSRAGYVDAIRAVGAAIAKIHSMDVSGLTKSAEEMGQFPRFNERELFRISRPGTGKLSYMLPYKRALK